METWEIANALEEWQMVFAALQPNYTVSAEDMEGLTLLGRRAGISEEELKIFRQEHTAKEIDLEEFAKRRNR